MNYEQISKDTMKAIYAAYHSLRNSPLDPLIRTLVELRTSQINSCAYCCMIHSKDARKAGASEQQLDELVDWQTSNAFDVRQKQALAYCESVTKTAAADKSLLEEHFSEREISDLTITIALMNGLNRIAINLREE